MSKSVARNILRFSCQSVPSTIAVVNTGVLRNQHARLNNKTFCWNNLSFVRFYASDSRKELASIPRLDSEGSRKFVYDNFGRLRVFLKFLIFQSVPIAIFAYCYRRFENERLSLYDTPLETADEVLRHFWSITRNALCFLLIDGNVYMVNYSVGNKIDFEGVDSAESFLNRLQQNPRDLLKSIYISYNVDETIENSLTSAKAVDLLFYNQSLDSFASVRSGAVCIEDSELKRKVWTPKLGDESNKLALLATRQVRIGFGGSGKSVVLENKEDWTLIK
ncbi:hypothetical protein X943_001069 [Babesia divergens]|uniref:Uncharacterized protein n=1 Tax=Babesia divergens TaxID=32595 RepID=A0AAD9GH92_BABDI|nr:hypothetical protein X943_001069 [Babesia divergens]